MRNLLNLDPAVQYVWLSLRARVAKVRSGELERGASAVEWVVISMVVVGICAAVGVILFNALNGRAKNVQSCIAGTTAQKAGC